MLSQFSCVWLFATLHEEKGTTEDEVVGCDHRLNEHEFKQLQEMVKDREASRTAVHVVTNSQTQLSDWTTTWTVARQAPLSMGFSRQEHWRQLPCPPPGDLPDPGIEPVSLMFPALPGGFFTTQFSSVAQSYPTLCDPMSRSTPGLPVHHQLLEFTQTHVHQVSDAIQPSHPRSSPFPPAPNSPQNQSLF